MRIFVLFAHPDVQSFNGRLAEAYCAAATAGGHEVRRTNLFELDFDPVLRAGLKRVQPLENDLIAAQALLNHARIDTTERYIRGPEAARLQADTIARAQALMIGWVMGDSAKALEIQAKLRAMDPLIADRLASAIVKRKL